MVIKIVILYLMISLGVIKLPRHIVKLDCTNRENSNKKNYKIKIWWSKRRFLPSIFEYRKCMQYLALFPLHWIPAVDRQRPVLTDLRRCRPHSAGSSWSKRRSVRSASHRRAVLIDMKEGGAHVLLWPLTVNVVACVDRSFVDRWKGLKVFSKQLSYFPEIHMSNHDFLKDYFYYIIFITF